MYDKLLRQRDPWDPGILLNRLLAFLDQALSYFYNTSVDESYPGMILGGDRNMSPAAAPTAWQGAGIATVVSNALSSMTVSWWKEKMHQDQGNVVLADGSAQQLNITRLRQQFQQGPRTNEISWPKDK